MFIILYLWEGNNRIMVIMCNPTLRYTNNFHFDSLCVLVNINTIYPDTLSFLNSIPISSKRFNMQLFHILYFYKRYLLIFVCHMIMNIISTYQRLHLRERVHSSQSKPYYVAYIETFNTVYVFLQIR